MKSFIKNCSIAMAVACGFMSSASRADTVVTEATFGCVQAGTKIRNTFIRHSDPEKLKQAVHIFETKTEGVEYPEGTILQLVPGEAMVKQSKAVFPKTNGWEFFALQVSADGTKITGRGEKASNRAGTCLSCHEAGVKFDYVCEKDHGCAPVPITDERIAAMQANDPRCKAK